MKFNELLYRQFEHLVRFKEKTWQKNVLQFFTILDKRF